MLDTGRCLHLLRDWAHAAEKWWYAVDEDGSLGCYGTGYDAWGVQTNQKYVGALATLAARGKGLDRLDRAWARDRALAGLRYSLATHVSGRRRRTDASQWGHTWISALGLERMLYGVYLIDEHLADADREALRRVIASEADWLLEHYERGGCRGVVADKWAAGGKNAPESNVWNGCLLWRAAATCPGQPHADAWREEAHEFLLNAVSIEADVLDERVVAGRRVCDRFVGANFFDHFALDHHGYLNVGYMIICLSNAAMLHFDMKHLGAEAPESLYHHQADLWRVARRMVFADGRLARIGGDSRIRYAYCQDYLLPALLLAADAFGDAHAPELANAQIDLIAAEAADGDGSFYGRRLAHLAEASAYYYTRLESDRACALAMAAAHAPLASAPPPAESFEASVAGAWSEPEHGAVLHRCPTRFASFAWRSYGLAQGLCLPPDRGHLAEWLQNLGGLVRFQGDGDPDGGGLRRRLVDQRIAEFDGGFATVGTIIEGCELPLAEGWVGRDLAEHRLAFVALPDGHTVVGLQRCVAGDKRLWLREVKGMHLGIPNDLFNDFTRGIRTAVGRGSLAAPALRDGLVDLRSPWANLDEVLGVVGLYGARTLTIDRAARRRAGKLGSLFVEEINWSCRLDAHDVRPREVILDVGWAVLAGVDARITRSFAEANPAGVHRPPDAAVRAVCLRAVDGESYLIAANFQDEPAEAPLGWLCGEARPTDLAAGRAVEQDGAGEPWTLPPASVLVCRLEREPP